MSISRLHSYGNHIDINASEVLFCFQSVLLKAQSWWFALYERSSEKSPANVSNDIYVHFCHTCQPHSWCHRRGQNGSYLSHICAFSWLSTSIKRKENNTHTHTNQKTTPKKPTLVFTFSKWSLLTGPVVLFHSGSPLNVMAQRGVLASSAMTSSQRPSYGARKSPLHPQCI